MSDELHVMQVLLRLDPVAFLAQYPPVRQPASCQGARCTLPDPEDGGKPFDWGCTRPAGHTGPHVGHRGFTRNNPRACVVWE